MANPLVNCQAMRLHLICDRHARSARTACADTVSGVGGKPDAHRTRRPSLSRLGRSSLEERCHSCKKPSFCVSACHERRCPRRPCTMSPARSRLATDLLVDLATFFHPPTLYQPLYVLTPPDAASAMMACGEQVPAGWRYPCRKPTFVR